MLFYLQLFFLPPFQVFLLHYYFIGHSFAQENNIDTVVFFFYSYLIENEVCYLVLAERNYSKRLAFSYLEDLAQEFHSQYGKRVNTVTRPYTFIEFGK